ncbi:DNA-binding domain-containing protein [Rhodovulum euryhalinum]|uniref:Putative DNA-binding protein n=1 Tax=Rhodovulum euryhalinum TaxID=35805 RepID=A0A4R2KHI7_9RHOB|nr:DNA-binding domain-containing protein [Rhodovulum euryhalinum]TCO71902.1 putative DNA-binding protein [Rhodovulum euryhalinum]
MMTRQDEFAAALLDPDRAYPPGLLGKGGPPAARRFDVYRNNVVASLIEALETGFPVVRALVGAPFFKAMAGEFVRRHPPLTPLLMLYGAELPGFLKGFPPVDGLPYLPDIARLELALRESYHAADAAPIAPEALAALPPEALARARLRLAPAVRLIRSDWPVHGIWMAHNGGPNPQPEPEEVLVARPGFDPVLRRLPAGSHAVLLALSSGGRLGDVLAGAPPNFHESNISILLQILLETRAICGISTEELS